MSRSCRCNRFALGSSPTTGSVTFNGVEFVNNVTTANLFDNRSSVVDIGR
jgi:hypothetical protein